MRKKKYKFVKKKEAAVVSADPNMCGVCGMMAVCVLHSDIEREGRPQNDHALKYLRDYLSKYKKYQEKVRVGLASSQQQFVVDRAELNRRPPPAQVKQVRETIETEMEHVWKGKKRITEEVEIETETVETETVKIETETVEIETETVEIETETETPEIDWAARFAEEDAAH